MESKDTTSKVEGQGLRNLQSDYFIIVNVLNLLNLKNLQK